jgi:hypothetical protein
MITSVREDSKLVGFMDKYKSKSRFMFFNFALEERTIDVDIFLETHTVFADEHAGHVSQLFGVRRELPFD